MKTKQLKKLSDFLEKKVVNDVEGIREEGDLTNENRRFPDTYYYDSFQPEYDKRNQEISFEAEMVADTGEYCENGLPVGHENGLVYVEYDIINDSISVKAESENFYDDEGDDDVEYMKEVLSDLQCRIEEDEDFLTLLRKETSHLRPEEEPEKTEENPNLIWDGTKGCLCNFSLQVDKWNYKYLVKCFPLIEGGQKNLGAACWDDDKLVQQLKEFTKAGYVFQVQEINEEYIADVKNTLCNHTA